MKRTKNCYGRRCLVNLLAPLFLMTAVPVLFAAQTNVLHVELCDPAAAITSDTASVWVNPPDTNLNDVAQFPFVYSSSNSIFHLRAYDGTNYIFWDWSCSEGDYDGSQNWDLYLTFPTASGTNNTVEIQIRANYRLFTADTDGDGMYDWWERQYGLEYRLYDENGNPVYGNIGDNGANGNPDGDYVPGTSYPLSPLDTANGYKPNEYIPFKNIWEFGGFDEDYSTTNDNPRTDPQNADTDNDGLPDGWEYYFWELRHNQQGLAWVTINPFVSGDPAADDDGDGLNNIQEYENGTDPTHCDTDRDGMDDKWELDNGLNPLDPADWDDNPDGDQMAADEGLYHDEVYRRGVPNMEPGETAFDPRTAWSTAEGAAGCAHPNTEGYRNLDEYLGRDRVGRIVWGVGGSDDGRKLADASSDATDPQNADTDGDGIPDGWELYVGMDPNSDGDASSDGDGDNLSNVEEWRNARGESGGADLLGSWTNKLWPTDPGVIQDGTDYGVGEIAFAWRNVWVSTNVVDDVYDDGKDKRVFYGGDDFSWGTADGSTGIQGNVYYNDADSNGRWDFGEDIWADDGDGKYYSSSDTVVYAGGDLWSVGDGAAGIQSGLYFWDADGSGDYTFGEEIWEERSCVYRQSRDVRIWDGGHGDGWTTPDGAVGYDSAPFYYDLWIDKYVYIYWGTPGLTTNTPAGPFDPARDAAWLDYGHLGVYDGETILVGGPTNSEQGMGLLYVRFRDDDSDGDYTAGEPVWVDSGSVVGKYDGGDIDIIAGALSGDDGVILEGVIWVDADSNGTYTAGEDAWIDEFVHDGLYTHDVQIYPTNPAPAQTLLGNEMGTVSGLCYYHNDPHPIDTDFDGLEDGDGTGVYGNIPYGEKNKLTNPTTVDSDRDALPDGWEVYAGTDPLFADASPAQLSGAPEGNPDEDDENSELPLSDLSDPDGDGLVNNLEYWTGCVYEWMHLDKHRFPNVKLVTRMPMIWDMENSGGNTAIRSDWLDVFIPPDFVSCPSFEVSNGQRARTAEPYVFYHTTKADEADTDKDGMDDYWEIYHGLNPLKGAADYMATPKTDGSRSTASGGPAGYWSVGNDFSDAPHFKFGYFTQEWATVHDVVYALSHGSLHDHVGPFNLGLEMMDPDADGLPNLEEYSYETENGGRSFYHTDPTPFNRTDIGTMPDGYLSTRVGVYSFTRENYTFDNRTFPCKWKWVKDSPTFPFAFEMTEGYDSDNDIQGDMMEINSSMPDATGGSDPIDSRDPVRNRAVLLVATNHDFLRTLDAWVPTEDPDFLTRFTIEAWVMPVSDPAPSNQTVVERSLQLDGMWGRQTKANFRLGLTTNNTPFIMYNGRGGWAAYYAVAPYSYRVPLNKWSHIAGVYDGEYLRLYVNGNEVRQVATEEIPATGYNDVKAQRVMGTIIVGAREPDATNTIFTDYIFGEDSFGSMERISTAGYSLFSLTMQFEQAVPVHADEFFNGYLDEIRIWDGARNADAISATMSRKVARDASDSATLEYYYGFDDCPDPHVHWNDWNGSPVPDEPIIPANITQLQGPTLPMHRTIYAWDKTPQKSWVYYGSSDNPSSDTRWNYIVMAEDYALHLSQIPPMDDKYHPERNTNGVYTGELPDGYKNSSNPYEYKAGITRWAWERPIRDLVFLNGAVADGDVFVDVDAWFAEEVTNPDAQDADHDGLPDNWETEHGLDPNDASGDQGRNGDPDGDGLTNYYEYQAGLDPMNSDSDGDGVSDADEDMDSDGLSNLMEQNLETLPLNPDTDDDGLSDGEEVTGTDNIGGHNTALTPVGTSDPLSSLDPPVRRAMEFDGSARVIIPPQDKLMTTKWTIEMWVNPSSGGDGGVLISRYVEDLVSGESGINYEMGLTSAGGGMMRPYVRYQPKGAAEVRLDGSGPNDIVVNSGCDVLIPVNEWSHLASTYDPVTHELKLYIDGELRAYREDATAVPPTVFGSGDHHQGDEVTLGASRSTGAITSGFEGYLDELKFYTRAKSAEDVAADYNAPPSYGGGSAPYTIKFKTGWYQPSPGMSEALAQMPADQKVHALVQFYGKVTQADIEAMQNDGIEVVNSASPRACTLYATRSQIEALENMRWSGLLDPKRKKSPLLGSSSQQQGRHVLVQFFKGTPESNALAVAEAAGAVVEGDGYVASTYLVVEANDEQVEALAENDSVEWMMPAASWMVAGGGPLYLIDDGSSEHGLESAPFTVLSEGWDGPGQGAAHLTYYFYNGTDKLPGDEEQDVIVAQMQKWSLYAAVTWQTGSYGSTYSSDIFWEPIDGSNGILAMAFLPNDVAPETWAGDMIFDEDEDWHVGQDIDLEFVALHELGHVLGLGHSDDPTAVMYPFYTSGRSAELQPDDIAAVQSIYAKPDIPQADFRFDDGGETAEDFTEASDWLNDFWHAGTLDGAVFTTNHPSLDSDRDGDGMPDWWEAAYGLDMLNDADAAEDADGDGLSNLAEYKAGTSPIAVDSDLDGLSDYDDDSDGDSLPNGLEVNNYGSHPGRTDTDDDTVQDDAELAQGTDPGNSVSPFVFRALRFGNSGGDGSVVVPDRVLGQYTDRFGLTNWTLECLVKPAGLPFASEVSLIAREIDCSGLLTFQLGLTAQGKPFVRFNDWGGTHTIEVSGGNAVSTSEWTHLAGRFADGELFLFVDGIPVGSENTGFIPAQGHGDLTFGGAGFVGDLKEIRIWRIAREDVDIDAFRNRSLFFDSSAADPGILRVHGGDGHLRESSTTKDPIDGEFIDNLEYWTLECWVKTDDSGGGTLITRWNTSGGEADDDFNYYLGIDGDGHLLGRFTATWLEITTSGTNSATTNMVIDAEINNITGVTPINDGKWHHVAYVRDETNAILYVDGEVDAKQDTFYVRIPPPNTTIVSPDVRSLDGPVVIGKNLAADIDEVRIWKRGISEAELREYKDENLVGNESGLITYFNFDYQNGSNAEDRAWIRDQESEYGRYIPAAEHVETGDGPPISVTPLRVYRRLFLAGYYAADDGGETLEDFVHPLDWNYAGTLTGDVAFVDLPAADVPYTGDSDGDGLPDWWETIHGLDPGSDVGDDGAWGDPDKDGLNNRAEYMTWTDGTGGNLDPRDFDTDDDGVGDYDSRQGAQERSWGERYSDGDGIADLWETEYPSVLSPLDYDADDDPDQDGWSNLGEFLGSGVDTNGALVGPTDPTDVYSYPQPSLEFVIKYHGTNESGHVIINVYHEARMDGPPDAVLDVDVGSSPTWPLTIETNVFTSGHIHEGDAWFFAFVDSDSSGSWNEGEPAGVAQRQPVHIGWDDVGEVAIGLRGIARLRTVFVDRGRGGDRLYRSGAQRQSWWRAGRHFARDKASENLFPRGRLPIRRQ